GSIHYQLTEFLIHQAVDAATVHRDFDVLLARPDVVHLHRLAQLIPLVLRLLHVFGLLLGERFGDGRGVVRLFCLRSCFVSHGLPPPEVKKAEKGKKPRTASRPRLYPGDMNRATRRASVARWMRSAG